MTGQGGLRGRCNIKLRLDINKQRARMWLEAMQEQRHEAGKYDADIASTAGQCFLKCYTLNPLLINSAHLIRNLCHETVKVPKMRTVWYAVRVTYPFKYLYNTWFNRVKRFYDIKKKKNHYS